MFLSWLPSIKNDPHQKIFPGALRNLTDLFWPELQRVHAPSYNFVFQSLPTKIPQPHTLTPVSQAIGHPQFSTANLAVESNRLQPTSNDSFIQQLIYNH